MQAPPRDRWIVRKLRKVSDSILDHPWRFIAPQLILFVLCAFYAWKNLGFSAARADLVSEKLKYQRDYIAFKKQFDHPDVMIAMAESDSPEKNRLFIERLASRIQSEPTLFDNTFYKGDLNQFGRKGLLFLSQDNLDEVSKICREDWPFIQKFSQANNLNTALRALNKEFREGSPTVSTDEEAANVAPALRVFRRTLDQASRSITEPLTNRYPGLPTLYGDQSRLYLSFSEGRIYALVTHAKSPKVEEKAVGRLWQMVHQTRAEIGGVNAGLTGEPVLNHDEMHQASADINTATLISLLLAALIFIIGFHEVTRPLLATFCLLVGIGFSLGFTALTVGHLNIISITLVPILVGVAIDFGVHFISRYEEELFRGHPHKEALRRAYRFTGLGIITSSLTIAGAFFAMMLTDFKGIQEMGFIAGAGILLCLIPMMTLLPLLLLRRDRIRRPNPPRHRCPPAWIERVWLQRPRVVLGAAATLTLLALFQCKDLRFDYNLLHLQSADLPAVETEQKLIQASSQSVLYGVVMADSLEEATVLQRKLEKLEPVASVTSLVNYLAGNPELKLQRIREIKARVDSLQVPSVDLQPVNLLELNETLFALQGYLGWAPYFIEGKHAPEALKEIEALRDSVIKFRSLVSVGSTDTSARLTDFQQGIFKNLRDTIDHVRGQEVASMKLDDVPDFLRKRFVSRDGKYLLQVHPKEDVWQREHQEQFIGAIRLVAPNVTGTVVQIHEFTGLMKDNFVSATLYAAALIGLVLYFQFKRLKSVVLAFLPVALGLCWTLGLMAYLQMPFNPVNILGLVLLTGIGVSNGIHILIRFAQDAKPAILSKSTGKAVLVSAFTTMAGFGSLVAAKHQGIASLGAVMAIGTGLCMVASVTVLPALMVVLSRKPVLAPAGNALLTGPKLVLPTTAAGPFAAVPPRAVQPAHLGNADARPKGAVEAVRI